MDQFASIMNLPPFSQYLSPEKAIKEIINNKEKVAEILTYVDNLLNCEERWCQGSLAYTAEKEPTEAIYEDAVCYCLVGAFTKAQHDLSDENGTYTKLSMLLYHVIILQKLGKNVRSIYEYNDLTDTTFADVKSMLTKALYVVKPPISSDL